MLEKKIIYGKNCQVEVVTAKYMRCILNVEFNTFLSIDKLACRLDAHHEQIAENVYVLTDKESGQSFTLTNCKNGSSVFETEILVPANITDEQSDKIMETTVGKIENMIPELKDYLSSSELHLGSMTKYAKDFLLSDKDKNILHSSDEYLCTARS